jgi:glutamate synthase domain-containing protein 3
VSDEDVSLLYRLISRHVEYTGSPRAKWILENWESMLEKFIKVFPHEFKRVLGIPQGAAMAASNTLVSAEGVARG